MLVDRLGTILIVVVSGFLVGLSVMGACRAARESETRRAVPTYPQTPCGPEAGQLARDCVAASGANGWFVGELMTTCWERAETFYECSR